MKDMLHLQGMAARVTKLQCPDAYSREAPTSATISTSLCLYATNLKPAISYVERLYICYLYMYNCRSTNKCCRAQHAALDAQGEITVVVDGKTDINDSSAASRIEAQQLFVRDLMDNGVSASSAAKLAVKHLNASKREIYDFAKLLS